MFQESVHRAITDTINSLNKSQGLRALSPEKSGLNRVRLFAHPRDGKLYLEYRDEVGGKKRVSLGHDDFTRGKVKANELAAALLKHEGPRDAEVTLKALFDNYEGEVEAGRIIKSPGKRLHDKRARSLFEACWGSSTRVRDLDVTHWNAFISQRRSGVLRPEGTKVQRPVRNRMIEYDLRFLLAVLHWAEAVIRRGKPLLDRNPFRGFEVPREVKPKRPLVAADECAKIDSAARSLGPGVLLFYQLAHETGHRGNAIRQLRWNDVDFERGVVLFRGETDKSENEHELPLSGETTEQLRLVRRNAAHVGDGWVFPDPQTAMQPMSRYLVIEWWKKLEKASGLRRVKGRGWHSLRRKFANDLDKAGVSLPVAAKLGGWSGTKTLTTVYIQPDESTLRTALAKVSKLRATG